MAAPGWPVGPRTLSKAYRADRYEELGWIKIVLAALVNDTNVTLACGFTVSDCSGRNSFEICDSDRCAEFAATFPVDTRHARH